MRVMLCVEEALQEVLSHCKRNERMHVPLKDAYGYILASDIHASVSVPPFDRAALDGYAVRAADIEQATPDSPVRLQVIERIGAGQVSTKSVGPGQAIRTMTGAPFPDGADTLVRLEMTSAIGEPEQTHVDVKVAVPCGEAVAREGEDIKSGMCMLRSGITIGGAEMALLATAGIASVPVYRKPVIGILASGRELTDIREPLAYGKIYDSNSYMLAGAVQAWGGIPRLLGRAGDDVDELVQTIQSALPHVDGLVTTGGVSVGDFDVMIDAYRKAGGEVHFWKVSIRPGTPFTFATIEDKPVFGLSGNPAAGFVNAMLFVQPAIRAISGMNEPIVRPVRAFLSGMPEVRAVALDRFLRADVFIKDGTVFAQPRTQGQKAAILSSLTGTQGFVRIPSKTQPQAGDLVDVYLLHMPVSFADGDRV
ncbi:molybdopterin molybdenumtransferase [Collibacillus ludicampi]|uniref:Molybdopterin molybdenumtransferase n=1 Tax=Collibacillus ludicampi TaxID=2771369 RepID=A0AAV4LEN2_9BACL|nr:gephyrin-like molybdotransferase Glp [Collibacillus ludicampi]GIM46325.1 molybdopterin molybdenumtransferase [Collibacillus ludicampi]